MSRLSQRKAMSRRFQGSERRLVPRCADGDDTETCWRSSPPTWPGAGYPQRRLGPGGHQPATQHAQLLPGSTEWLGGLSFNSEVTARALGANKDHLVPTTSPQ